MATQKPEGAYEIRAQNRDRARDPRFARGTEQCPHLVQGRDATLPEAEASFVTDTF